MHTEYFLLTADVTVQVPVTLIVPAQTCGKSRPVPVRNPSCLLYTSPSPRD